LRLGFKSYGAHTSAPTLPETVQNVLFYALTSAVLDALALSGDPQPYSVVAPIVGYHYRDRNFFKLLGQTLHDDFLAGKPLRATLVINKQTGMPGSSYFDVCRDLGYVIPVGQENVFWLDQLKRFF